MSCHTVPARQETPSISLQGDGGLPDLSVAYSLKPSSHRLLDLDAGVAELVGSELLQIGHLSGPEEDLCLSKLELIWVLKG